MKKLILISIGCIFALSLTACFDNDHEHGGNSHSHEKPNNTHDTIK